MKLQQLGVLLAIAVSLTSLVLNGILVYIVLTQNIELTKYANASDTYQRTLVDELDTAWDGMKYIFYLAGTAYDISTASAKVSEAAYEATH